MGSELGGGGACVGFGVSSFRTNPALPHQTYPNWTEQPLGEKGKASPSYAIVKDARGCWEVVGTVTSGLVQSEHLQTLRNREKENRRREEQPKIAMHDADGFDDVANVISEYRPLKF